MPQNRPAVLFVCLGNICRSPLAEAAFRMRAQQAGLDAAVDSAGTASYHIGKPPDARSIAVAAEHGIDIAGLKARQLSPKDFTRFTHIFGLDASNVRNIRKAQRGADGARIGLLRDCIPGVSGDSVADPYYGGPEDFAIAWREVDEAAQALVAQLQR